MLSVHPVAFAAAIVSHLSAMLNPVGGAVAAIIVLTLAVRLAVHPLTRAAVRGERARARLAPRIAELHRKHGKDLTTFGEEMATVYRGEKISPFAGMLPMLAQAPVFIVLYRVFAQANGPLAAAHLLGVPLSARFIATAGGLGVHVAVFAVLFAALAALAWWNARRARVIIRANAGPPPSGAMAAVLRFAPYALLISGAVLPLAAGIYLVTSTAWSAAENTALRRGLA